MKKINTPHDRYFRSQMSNPKVAREFFECHLPANIRSLINLDTLSLRKESYIDEELELSVTDMLYSVKFGDREGYIYLLAEHQSTPDALMPFRILKYIVAIMDQHLQETNETVLPVIYPLVLYHGAQSYPYSMDLFDLFGEFSDLARATLYQPYQLIDLGRIPDEEIKKYLKAGIMQLTLKRIWTKKVESWIYSLFELLEQVEKEKSGDYITRKTIRYILTASEDLQAFIAAVKKSLSPKLGAKIMTIAEELEMKGRSEEKRHIALNLLNMGLAIDAICRATRLPQEVIEALEEEMMV